MQWKSNRFQSKSKVLESKTDMQELGLLNSKPKPLQVLMRRATGKNCIQTPKKSKSIANFTPARYIQSPTTSVAELSILTLNNKISATTAVSSRKNFTPLVRPLLLNDSSVLTLPDIVRGSLFSPPALKSFKNMFGSPGSRQSKLSSERMQVLAEIRDKSEEGSDYKNSFV